MSLRLLSAAAERNLLEVYRNFEFGILNPALRQAQ